MTEAQFPSQNGSSLVVRHSITEFVPLAVGLIFLLMMILIPRSTIGAPTDPSLSTLEPVIVGNASGTGYPVVNGPAGTLSPGFQVIARDVTAAPQNHETIILDFSQANVRLFGSQNSGTTLNCPAKTLSSTTNLQGTATFFPRFGGFDNRAIVRVTSSGILLGFVPAISTDLDGADGQTGPGDLTLFAGSFLHEPGSHPEADFDQSGGRLGLGDLVIFSGEFLSGSQGAYCP